MLTRLTLTFAAALFAVASGPIDASASAPQPARPASMPALVEAIGPGFLENGGRLPDAVDFTLDGRDRTFFFGPGCVTISIRDAKRPASGRWVLKLVPEGARQVRPVADEVRPGITSLLTGPRESWHSGLRSFGRLVYRDLWPGIDLVWRAETGRLKWECRVRPGADPSAVAFALRGAERLTIGADGGLTASTPLGEFADAAPVAWQTVGGRDVPVEASFRLDAARKRLAVAVGAHDPALELVIDPATVVRSAFVGGGLDDVATSVAVDGARNTYVAGVTRSPEATFPVASGADLTFNGGTDDAFVVKLDSVLKPVWSTYIGGSSSDAPAAIAVDVFGAAYVTGATLSANFPVVGALSPVRGGGYDAFVVKIASSGRSLAWSGVFGGAGDDRGLAIAVDRSGRALCAGRTAGGMPWTGSIGGTADAFAMGVHADGSILDWGTYLGGSAYDSATGAAVDTAGNLYLCGDTSSSESSFPVSGGPDLTHNGGQDVWVAKIEALNHTLVYAGYVGGAAWDASSGIAVDSLGRAYVVGSTTSDATTFPVLVGPHLVQRGKSDAFVARVAANGAALEYCGFVGGSGDDFGYGIALDTTRRAYLVGTTGSTERAYPSLRAQFPVVEGPDLTFNGGVHDGWFGVVEPNGAQMDALGYVGGGSNVDDATAVALYGNGEAAVVGDTASAPKTFPSGTGAAPVQRGGREAFVTQIQFVPASPHLGRPRLDAASVSGADVVVGWTDTDTLETGFEVQRTAADGTSVLFPVATPAAPTGPVQFTDTTAPAGTPFAYRVRGTSVTGKGEFSDLMLVVTEPSLALKLQKSVIGDAGLDGQGTVALRLKYKFQPGSVKTELDPVADGISLTLSGTNPDQTFIVAPNDSAWISNGNTRTWTEFATGGGFTIDVVKRTMRFDASGLSLGLPAAKTPIRVTVRSGVSHGARTDGWRGLSGIRLLYP